MFWLFMTTLWMVMLVAPLALLVALLPAGRNCPRCGGETLPIRSVLLAPLHGLIRRRWCIGCGWEGLARRPGRPSPAPAFEVVPDDADGEDAPWRGGA